MSCSDSHFMCPQNLTNKTTYSPVLRAIRLFLSVHLLVPRNFAAYRRLPSLATLLFGSCIFSSANTSFRSGFLYIFAFSSPAFCHKQMVCLKFKKIEEKYIIIKWAITSTCVLFASSSSSSSSSSSLCYPPHLITTTASTKKLFLDVMFLYSTQQCVWGEFSFGILLTGIKSTISTVPLKLFSRNITFLSAATCKTQTTLHSMYW
jgi:hypothetical protein